MQGLDILLIILIALAFLLIIRHLFNSKKSIKPMHIKKDEIVSAYKQQMFDLNEKYKYDEKVLKQQKMIFLKSVSAELHKNIFFDEDEIKQIIKSLAAL